MKLLWLTWKDPYHPQAGGAEVVQAELCKRLVADGHQVTVLTAMYDSATTDEMRDGVRYIRGGNRYTVGLHAWRLYRQYGLRGWADQVIEEVNTGPFLARFYIKESHILFFHQLTKVVWFYQFPWFLAPVGYVAEIVALALQWGRSVITVSDSTKADLVRHGFKADKISVISEGITIDPLDTLGDKPNERMLLSLGAWRPMKRTLDIVKAFEIAHASDPSLTLHLAGDDNGVYGASVLRYIQQSDHRDAVKVHGRVSHEEKMRLMRAAHAVAVTSIKEGWGLVVTEANSQGTPAVVYNVDGLRDSTRDGQTGLISAQNTPQSLADSVTELLSDQDRYQQLRTAGWEWSKTITFDQSYEDFMNIISAYGK